MSESLETTNETTEIHVKRAINSSVATPVQICSLSDINGVPDTATVTTLLGVVTNET